MLISVVGSDSCVDRDARQDKGEKETDGGGVVLDSVVGSDS